MEKLYYSNNSIMTRNSGEKDILFFYLLDIFFCVLKRLKNCNKKNEV